MGHKVSICSDEKPRWCPSSELVDLCTHTLTSLCPFTECIVAMRNEKDALERILAAKKVIEKGYQHRAVYLEKALSAKGGISYRLDSEHAGAREEELPANGALGQRPKMGEVDNDSFFHGDSTILSSVRDNTVLSGSPETYEEETVRGLEFRLHERSRELDVVNLPNCTSQRSRHEIQSSTRAGLQSTNEAKRNTADKRIASSGDGVNYEHSSHIHPSIVPRPPPHTARDPKHLRGEAGRHRAWERHDDGSAEGQRVPGNRASAGGDRDSRTGAGGDRGPRTHRLQLHPISISGHQDGVEAKPWSTKEQERRGRSSGALQGIGQMLNDDVEYLQRLVRGSGRGQET